MKEENTVAIRVTLTVEPDGDMYFGTCKEFSGVLVNGVSEIDCLEKTRDAVKEHMETFVPSGRVRIPPHLIVKKMEDQPKTVINSLETIEVPAAKVA